MQKCDIWPGDGGVGPLTTWLSVMTRSSVSQHCFTALTGNPVTMSLSRPSTCSVVVSSLLPEKTTRLGIRLQPKRNRLWARLPEHHPPPASSISLTQNLAVFAAAGWCEGAESLNRKSLPFRMAHTPCCAALRTCTRERSIIPEAVLRISTVHWHYVKSAPVPDRSIMGNMGTLALGLEWTVKLSKPW